MTKRSDFQIDELDIQTEWLRQADLVKEYGDHQADAQQSYDKAKAALEVAKFEAAKAIRKEPGRYGVVKDTEKAIEQAIPSHPAVAIATSEVIDARHDLDVAKAAVSALDHKRTAMSSLVQLIQLGLWAEPKERKREGSGSQPKDRSQSGRARGLRDRERRKQ